MQRAVAEHRLQLEREEEQHGSEGAVDDEGHEVGAGELPAGEQRRLDHGVLRPPLDGDEAEADGETDENERDGPRRAEAAVLDEGIRHQGQRRGGEDRPQHVEAVAGLLVAGLGNGP